MPAAARRRSRLLLGYVLAVCVGSVVVLATHLPPWPEVSITIWKFLAFLGLAIALDLMVVPLAGGSGASASFAVYFGGLLAFGFAPTAWVAAIASLASDGLLKRRSLMKASFNAAHSVLSLAAAGVVYDCWGGRPGILVAVHLPSVVFGAIALWVLETTWVALVVALERGSRAWGRLVASLRPMLALDAALASVGLLLALLYQRSDRLLEQEGHGLVFLVAVAMIPSGLLYYAYRLQGHLRQTYTESLQTLGSVVEAKLQHSQPGHGGEVAALAVSLAQALELPPEQIEQIRYASLLHDIGKVGVPARFLHRERDAFEGRPPQLRQHAEIGVQILSPVQFLRPAAEMVRAHHERWDGLGYPDRLQGPIIPVGARILSIADAYQGFTHGYGQAPLTPEQAMLRVRDAAGSRFDPALVELLEHTLRARGILTRGAASGLAYAGLPTP